MNNNNITPYQNTSMLILTSFIFQIMFIPLLFNFTNGPTAWISILIAMVLGIILLKPIRSFQKELYDKTILDICYDYLPVYIVKIIGVFYILFFILASSILLKNFSEQVKIFMLYKTPANLIILIILLTSSYATQKGITTIGQIGHITLIIALVPLLIVTIFSTLNANITNLFPIVPIDIVGVLKGVPLAFGSYFGFVILLFSNSFVRLHRMNYKQNKLFFILSSAIYILSFFLIVFKFGNTEAKRLMWPFAQILKFLYVPGAFIENLEAIGISLNVICAFVCLSLILYFTDLCLQKTLKTKENGYFIFIQTPIIYVVACLLPGVNIILKYIYIPIYIFAGINILLVFMVSIVNKKRSKVK